MTEEVKTVLIVDDDEVNRRAYSEMLEISKFRVISAADG
ncbi:MAG: DNA-binding response regulator, partial [Planctomycetes bacterium]|nr:DNA-binding response regulator [Planctomycetota bacterium]